MAMPVMKSMKMDDEEQYDAVTPIPMDKPDFPPGLRICLTEAEFEKLGLDHTMAERGAKFEGCFSARIMYVHHTQDERGDHCRIEAQIEELGIDSSEE